MTSRESVRNVPAVVVLVTANAIMAISQTNMASIYFQVSTDFHQTLFGLGLLTAVYFAGYGLFEVPGSIAAARVGPKKLVVFGGLLTSSALVGGAFAPSFGWLILFRALAGVGYGLLFAPTLVLIIRNLGGSSVGLGAALATVSFSLGGFSGILGWSVLSAAVGWRPSLIAEFAITLASVLVLLVLLPKDELKRDFRVRLSHLREALTSRPIIALALSVVGVGATANLTGTFIVYYLEETFRLAPGIAGLIGSATFIAPAVTGIVAGRLYDRGVGAKVLLTISALSLTAGTAVVAFPSVGTALLGSVVAGLAVGIGGTAAFSAARNQSSSPEYETLSVSIVDGASLIGLFASPLYFSAIALASGYSMAWLVGSVAAVVFLVPVLLVKVDRKPAKKTQMA